MNNANDNKKISTIAEENALDTPKSQEDRFIIEYLDCRDVREAGRRAGYAESVMTSGYLYSKFKNPKFQEKFRSVAIAREYQDMAYIYSLERKALEEANKQATDKPESAIRNLSKLKHTLKQKKQIIGILGQDTPSPFPTISINNAQILMAKLNHGSPEEQEAISLALGLKSNPKPIEVLDKD